MNWGHDRREDSAVTLSATCNKQPLGYAALAAQKNAYSLYLMAAGTDSKQEMTLKKAYAGAGRRLDMGKCCLRFRKFEDLLVEPIARLIASTPVDAHIATREASRSK